MLDRRDLMKRAGLAALVTGLGSRGALALDTVTLPFGNGERPLVRYPQKRPMIGLTARPPQLETPFAVFNDGPITPNNAFFVRYHLADLPYNLDPDKFTLEIKGKVDKPLKLSLKDIRKLKATDIVAVNQCSGNSRGFFSPRVAGGQLGNGAMGCARWHGVPLKTVLDMAGVQAGAKQLTFNGMDGPVSDKTPDFVKALDIDHARDGEVMLAWGMNGEDLPFLNGFPLRLVVPGYYGTYWVKHLNEITVIDNVFEGFWMKSAYRIPDTPNNAVEPGTAPKATIPINRFTVRSFITSVADGAKLKAGRTMLRGIAFDGGKGIKEVMVSTDGGKSWTPAKLGKDLGKYAFREWKLPVKLAAGPAELKVRATNNAGDTQPMDPLWNPAGYLRNVVETVRVTAA
ncbi:sulfite dehydrogenase [Bradyrhizobium sp. USDA 4524]|uniref:SorA family sulfite dehydrogenase catalytic subunit n=1 Tax=unclassified Bradyrhizobium TaxID=2631580 RepID=UPI00209E6ABA|nr:MULTISPECIES: molybdopterin-dependent oxidoreductase [unclassified Bradyrhizobium]MCP1842275.1 DMSO/TMAO reductase YedYZ molybdopterin-dependent catalytic subunit [Bradyrhizobium sp. USDA 4538]MCP1902839.1 DMSO/TMAO reductase YedYZ molybdopterin-dependent catalytic subunit [Bradyrhizobium sp. USDA 4537]MCP1991504.1 DMSO/TMAO reductase YedYZ molybdopterin-dependent catalytic subunit [Bradyrhizobium sp. USDA 4539]